MFGHSCLNCMCCWFVMCNYCLYELNIVGRYIYIYSLCFVLFQHVKVRKERIPHLQTDRESRLNTNVDTIRVAIKCYFTLKHFDPIFKLSFTCTLDLYTIYLSCSFTHKSNLFLHDHFYTCPSIPFRIKQTGFVKCMQITYSSALYYVSQKKKPSQMLQKVWIHIRLL